MKKVKFIDLFAGLGGMRLGFEKAFRGLGLGAECVMTSEIKPCAAGALAKNFAPGYFVGDIFKVGNEQIPDFDFLLGGFPCQPFSAAGKRQGFADTRGTLFFEIERVLRHKKPYGFILENVEGLIKHDLSHKGDAVGRTMKTILHNLGALGYKVTWEVLDSIGFGLPQSRKRVFIVGTKHKKANLRATYGRPRALKSVLESGLGAIRSDFTEKLLARFEIGDLYGKSIKDKRGGKNNIHSWDIGLKGRVSGGQVVLLNRLFKERRKKHWAKNIGIDWMDGMPLTLLQISTFYKSDDLGGLLGDLVNKGYLRFERPKKLVREKAGNGERKYRAYDETKPKGYNIVTGKLSFEINKILDPDDIAPALVATDISRLAVPDNGGLRRLTIREGLRLFGYPEWYEIPVKEKKAFGLLGNTVAVPVVEHVAKRAGEAYMQGA